MADQKASHRFRCTCGKENAFKVAYGPARKVKVRCGGCSQVCGIDIPERSLDQSVKEFMRTLGLDKYNQSGDLFKSKF